MGILSTIKENASLATYIVAEEGGISSGVLITSFGMAATAACASHGQIVLTGVSGLVTVFGVAVMRKAYGLRPYRGTCLAPVLPWP
jgi:hypothetical protein